MLRIIPMRMLARLNIIVSAHARIRISMRMHTYTRAYVIYKVARDRVITWAKIRFFVFFASMCHRRMIFVGIRRQPVPKCP